MTDITNSGFIPEKRTVCALGLFDGVHRGHQLIITMAVKKAQSLDGHSAVFCFKTDTVTSKGHDGRIEMLMSDEEKHKKMAELGVEVLFSPDFAEFKGMSPEDFVKKVLKERLNCSGAVCGNDFTFGKGAQGKAVDLKRLGEKYDIDVEIVSPLLMGGEVISSTEIRRCVREGEIAKANEMLGYHFGFCLEVEHGFQRGRTWDFPTINQQIPKGRVMPKFGVYCSAVEIDGNKYAGVTNIGVKPTVHVETAPLAETFIMDYHGDLYGRKLKLELHEFLRPEKMFDSFDSLREEIAKNKEQAVRYFEENGI